MKTSEKAEAVYDNLTDVWGQAKRLAELDLRAARQHTLWPQAVAWIRADLPDVVKEKIRNTIPMPEWPGAYHFGWGMSMRNSLRKNGFGEDDFGITNLDNIYVELVEEAVCQK